MKTPPVKSPFQMVRQRTSWCSTKTIAQGDRAVPLCTCMPSRSHRVYRCGTHVGIGGCASAEGSVPEASNSRITLTPGPVRETGVCAERQTERGHEVPNTPDTVKSHDLKGQITWHWMKSHDLKGQITWHWSYMTLRARSHDQPAAVHSPTVHW